MDDEAEIDCSNSECESDKEDKKYDECDLRNVKRLKRIKSKWSRYKDIKCVFCLQEILWKEGKKLKGYPTLNQQEWDHINAILDRSKRYGTLDISGSMEIANYFNLFVRENHRKLEKGEVKYPKITAEDVTVHFTSPDHLWTTENIINSKIKEYGAISKQILDETGLFKEHKIKKSKKTGDFKLKINKDHFNMYLRVSKQLTDLVNKRDEILNSSNKEKSSNFKK